MMLPRPRAILFDLDGTLIDSAPQLGAAADRMRTARGMPSLPLGDYRPMAGAGARGMLGVAFGMTPADPTFPEMREEFFRNYEARMHEARVFEGIQSMLEALREADLPWGVVTNKSMRFTEPLAQALPLLTAARAIVGGDSTPFSKPHPEPLLEAARRMKLPPVACWYVGDDERDMRAGRAAGMQTVAARYGYLGSDADLTLWEADAVIDSPLDLLKLLASD